MAAKIVDLRTGEESDAPPPVPNPAIEDVLNSARLHNYQGRVAAVIVVLIDHSNDAFYLPCIPDNMPATVAIGAVRLTEVMLERDIHKAALTRYDDPEEAG
jgi:hypothetical protein